MIRSVMARRAILAAAMEQPRRGRLLIVGTPIGNLEDFSPRARRALEQADAIFCEDTRVTGKLASRFGLNAPRISTPAPRERSRVPELMRRLGEGETVALVSDAGMPLLSDPGQELVNAAAEGGYSVQVVPGPSAPAAALAVSGISAVPHLFVGFLPARSGERRRFLEALRSRQETLVWFESPHRLVESLQDAASILGERRACVARELTKIHEEAARGTLGQLALLFRSRGTGRGEATVVVEGGPASEPALSEPEIDREIRAGLAGATPPRQLVREIARRSGRPAREIYARAIALSREAKGEGPKAKE